MILLFSPQQCQRAFIVLPLCILWCWYLSSHLWFPLPPRKVCIGYMQSLTPVHSRWKFLQDQDGICHLAALQTSTPLQPDVVQWWFQPQAFKGCSSALFHSLAKGPVYKVFSKAHLLKFWVNQGFIKFPIRCKIHFFHGPAKEISAIRLKEVTAKYFRELMFIDRDWFHPPCWSYSHTVSVSPSKIRF